MTPREVVKQVLAGQQPPYVPWSFRFTEEAEALLIGHYGTDDLVTALNNHLIELGSAIGFFEELGNDQRRDVFGVVWDRTIDKDIGMVTNCCLPEPTMSGYDMPDPLDPRFFDDIPTQLEKHHQRYRVFCIGFSLFERAWTLRGMENLLIDMIEHPQFVHDLLTTIADYNLQQVRKALEFDIDAVYFGDDWGQQHGLIMGYENWKQFIAPQLKRMYSEVRAAGKQVFIHSCGDVDELFDDLIDLGLNCFNPFQPEVMDIHALLDAYRGKLAFWGGLSTQKTLPYGTVDDVRAETRRLIERGRPGGYILSPSHAVESDVSLENMLVFIEEAQQQRNAPAMA